MRILDAFFRLGDGFQFDDMLDVIAKVVDVLQPVAWLQSQRTDTPLAARPATIGVNLTETLRAPGSARIELAQVVEPVIVKRIAYRRVQVAKCVAAFDFDSPTTAFGALAIDVKTVDFGYVLLLPLYLLYCRLANSRFRAMISLETRRWHYSSLRFGSQGTGGILRRCGLAPRTGKLGHPGIYPLDNGRLTPLCGISYANESCAKSDPNWILASGRNFAPEFRRRFCVASDRAINLHQPRSKLFFARVQYCKHNSNGFALLSGRWSDQRLANQTA